jgi:hypothetical protein
MIFITTAVADSASGPPMVIAASPDYPAKSVAELEGMLCCA